MVIKMVKHLVALVLVLGLVIVKVPPAYVGAWSMA